MSAVDNDPRRPVTSASEVPDGDWLTWTCGLCSAWIQGGRRGLDLHMRVVHPEGAR